MSLSIKTTITQLKAMKMKDGPYFQKLSLFEVSDKATKGPTTHSLVQLTKGHSDLQKEKLRDDICNTLSIRFEHGIDAFIKATSVVNFKQWPLEESELKGLLNYIFCC